MIKIIEKTKCCGCSACANKCPKKAIEMKEDEKGFKYPYVNKDLCINCGLCEKVCPIINAKRITNNPEAYACINKNDIIRKESSSGGIFTLIAEEILEKNGVVFGAAFDNNFKVQHVCVEKKEDLDILRTSKYTQSDILDTYRRAEDILKTGRLVLFTGTPCQIEGLRSYLMKEYGNLYTQDIICHGVPSPKVWDQYKKYRKKIDNEQPKNINFRNKDNGWSLFNLKFEYNDKSYSKNQKEDLYMKAFLNNLSLRDSCYECSFKKYNRISDITLADFWGINNIDKQLNDNKGVSLVIINSEKGRALLEKINEKAIIKKVDLDEAIKYNKSFIQSVAKNKNRDRFFQDLENKSFDKLIEENIKKKNIYRRTVNKLKSLLKKLVNA